jgi:hypothetical protein
VNPGLVSAGSPKQAPFFHSYPSSTGFSLSLEGRVGVKVEISIFSPSPLSPPAKGGDNLREIGGTFGKAQRKDSTD